VRPAWRYPYYGGAFRGRYPYYGGYYGRRYPYYRGYYGWGYPYYGAVAAGLALGSLAYPYYYGYPNYGYGYGYPYYGATYAPDCYWVRRRVKRHGHVVIRRVQVCGY
jgi:hypothetical protein